MCGRAVCGVGRKGHELPGGHACHTARSHGIELISTPYTPVAGPSVCMHAWRVEPVLRLCVSVVYAVALDVGSSPTLCTPLGRGISGEARNLVQQMLGGRLPEPDLVGVYGAVIA
jgi:hypothetical protein